MPQPPPPHRASGGAAAPADILFAGEQFPVTQRGLTIVELIADQNLMLVRGAVPGPKGSTVEVRTDG